MSHPSSDGKSDVDRPFLPERQGEAKQDFAKAQAAKPEHNRRSTDRQQGEADRTQSGGVGESIKKHTPAMSLDMPGGGQVKANHAAARLSKEAADEKAKQAAAKAAAKKMEKSGGKGHNNQKAQDKHNDKGRE